MSYRVINDDELNKQHILDEEAGEIIATTKNLAKCKALVALANRAEAAAKTEATTRTQRAGSGS